MNIEYTFISKIAAVIVFFGFILMGPVIDCFLGDTEPESKKITKLLAFLLFCIYLVALGIVFYDDFQR